MDSHPFFLSNKDIVYIFKILLSFTLSSSIAVNFLSCSLLKKEKKWEDAFSEYQQRLTDDYYDFLLQLESDFISSGQIKEITNPYLTRLMQNIASSNELFFTRLVFDKVKIYLLNDKRPVYFSLPGSIYISKRLMQKYIKNEHFLAIVLTGEMIKIEKMIFPRKDFINLGWWNVDNVYPLVFTPLDVKIELNKWTYLFVKRSGLDQDQILSWIQLKNRNYLDFHFALLGDSANIFKEEAKFKEFLVREIKESGISKEQKSSGSAFYQFISSMRRL